MNKKIIWTMVLLLFAVNVVVIGDEQTKEDLRAKYDASKMTVAGYSQDPASLGWTVTYGYKKINEPTFLRITGHEDIAQQSARRHLYKNSMLFGGLAVEVVGIGLMFLSLRNDNALILESPYFWAGSGVMFGGLVMTLFLGSGPRNILTYGQAERIADEYNQALLDDLFAPE
jgi:hypothetical protein